MGNIIELRKGNCCANPQVKTIIDPFQSYAICGNCDCRCVNPGQDDGQITCWRHHDCFDGSCTHMDGDDE